MNTDERDSVAAQFGVSPEQVERDHLISHLLAAISRGSVPDCTSSAELRLHVHI